MKNTVRVNSRRNNKHKYFYTGSSQTPRLRPVTWQPPSFHYNFSSYTTKIKVILSDFFLATNKLLAKIDI